MTNNIIPKAFTIEYSEVVSELETSLRISEAFDPAILKDVIHPPMYEFEAIWDTGATNSVISANVIKKLGIEPTGKERVYHANGMSIVDSYLVNVYLPNGVMFISLEVTEMLIDVDVLIGMDIISKGDFSITASQGNTKFSFQIPSTHDIDFDKK